MASSVAEFLDMLALAPAGPDLFRGLRPKADWRHVFGGQLVAQAMQAASRTVADGALHSLHCYFILAGNADLPFDYQVERLRDGRSFATRRVTATQDGQVMFSMEASFHAAEDGLDYQAPMRPAAAPDDAIPETDWLARCDADGKPTLGPFWRRARPFELRPVDLEPFVVNRAADGIRRAWARSRETLPDDPAIHRAMLAYISDYALLDSALLPHGRSCGDPDIRGASIDHAIWFHRPFRADDWLLYENEGRSTFGARGFTRGSFYDSQGVLVASVAQEGLIRPIGASR